MSCRYYGNPTLVNSCNSSITLYNCNHIKEVALLIKTSLDSSVIFDDKDVSFKINLGQCRPVRCCVKIQE